MIIELLIFTFEILIEYFYEQGLYIFIDIVTKGGLRKFSVKTRTNSPDDPEIRLDGLVCWTDCRPLV